MSEENQELELYKFVTEELSEYGWVSNTEFLLWLYHWELRDFVQKMIEIFGKLLLDDGGMDVCLMTDCVCIDLTSMLSGYDIDFEIVFPREKFKH